MNTFLERVKKALKRRLKRWTLSYLIWIYRQHYRKWRIQFLSQAKREHILKTLPEQILSGDMCVITATLGARYFGNRDNLLEHFLNSFLQMTEDSRRVEIFIKIDLDDDLLFFYRIKEKYGKRINVRFFPSERAGGYADMHIWHSTLIQKRSPSSRVLQGLTEDAEFIYKHWDKELLACMNVMPHKYFIGTPSALEETIEVMGPNPVHPVPVYWIRGDDFPSFSIPLLNITGRIASQRPGWTSFGNLFLVDSFSGDILKTLWQRHKINCHMRTPQLFRRLGVFSWAESPTRTKLRNETLLKFFLKENQVVRDEMADAIAQEVNRLSLVTKGSS